MSILIQSESMINKVNLAEKLGMFSDFWSPRIVGALNGQHIKLAKLKGEFIWHQHEQEDEMFLVLEGRLRMELRNQVLELEAGEFVIIPRGTEHRPVAAEEVAVLLFEPAGTLNTGDQQHAFTKSDLESI